MKADSSEPNAPLGLEETAREQFRLRVSRARHDLENLLGQILGFSELLLDELHEPDPTALHVDLEMIRQTATRITGQVREGLDWARVEPGLTDLVDLQQRVGAESDQLVMVAESLTQKARSLPDDVFKSDLSRILCAARETQELARTALAFGPRPDRPASERSHPSPVSRPQAQLSAETLGDDLPAGTPREGVILVVDDLEQNRAVLARLISRLGYTVRLADNGQGALDFVAANATDLILLDILMPGLDGIEVLQRLKANPATQHIPVIMLSSADQIATVVQCIKLGADDFLPKPFNTTLLVARIESSLSKKRLRDQERRTYEALLESQRRLRSELAEAAAYVRSLLPPPMEGEVKVRWCFQPSAQLGGDILGYHWVREGQLAIYLLDVSGHGVGAALLSVSVLNVLRPQSLPETDFCNPASVLGHLNRLFQMDQQNNLIFTLWYGVFDVARHQLTYASGGHPPPC